MTPDTKFVFFGTPEFAAIILQKLIDGGFAPSAIVCNPDRPVGRKKIITAPPVKRLIANGERQIAILQPEKLTSDVGSRLSDIGAEFAVVASYAKIIPKDIINLFPKDMIGVHPSLLPKYRGPSPIQSAMLAGEEISGVTLYLLDEKVDHGAIVSSVKCQVSSNDTYETLARKLAELGGGFLVEALPKFLAGEIKLQPQDESRATYTKKFSAEDAFIPPEDLEKAVAGDMRLAELIDRKIRALNPEPGAWTTQNRKRTKLLEAALEKTGLILKKIQIEGKKPKTLTGAELSE